MRTIKFRGQRIDNGEWVYGFLYLYKLPSPNDVVYMILTTVNICEDKSNEPQYHLAFTLWLDLFPVRRLTIGQYTGLKDKNGKEIYEGDIVEVYDFTSVYASKYRGVVKMVDCTWVVEREFYNSLSYPKLDFDDFAKQKTEIVGNIHDNPDVISFQQESEDERVRKAIHIYLDWLDGRKDYAPKGKYTIKDMIAWLEKQSNSSPVWKYKKDNKPLLHDSLILNKYGCVAKSPSGAIVSDVWVLDYDELATLPREIPEKQGEQKPTLRERYKNIAKSDWFKKNHDGMSVSDDEKVDDANYCFDCINKKGCINCENGELKETKQAPKTKMTEEERKAFEAALGTAWQKYCDGARLVDRFEDNYIECAFSKGFLQGYIAAKQTSTKEK